MDASDEPLVFELGYFVEGLEDDVGGEVSDAGAVHDEECVAFSMFELPLAFDGCGGKAGDATAACGCDGGVYRRGYVHVWSEAQVDSSCTLGGEDKLFFGATFLWGVVVHAEGEAEFVEFGLEVGVVDVANGSQFACFVFDFTECADLGM